MSYCGKVGSISKVYRKRLQGEQHNQGSQSINGQQSKKDCANVAKHKEEDAFIVGNTGAENGKTNN